MKHGFFWEVWSYLRNGVGGGTNYYYGGSFFLIGFRKHTAAVSVTSISRLKTQKKLTFSMKLTICVADSGFIDQSSVGLKKHKSHMKYYHKF